MLGMGEKMEVFEKLQTDVVRPGLCTHCGACVGLSSGALQMRSSRRGPLPASVSSGPVNLPETAWLACPGRGMNYPALNEFVFGARPNPEQPVNWLVGMHQGAFVGFSNIPEVRQRGASGGVITQTLLYLLTQGLVDGAVVLRQGWPEPYLATPVIARTEEEILAASQSVYIPTSVNTALDEMQMFQGRLAYVGLPDQVAALRRLQQLGHPGACKVEYVLGPYVGTGFYLEAIESYLHSNHVHGAGGALAQVAELRYRAGEWPGYLQITTRTGEVLRAKKFYYNYLIPFYITQACLLAVDFTNELTDISVGDAWHPRFEASGGGYSVVLARSSKAQTLLRQMQAAGLLTLQETSIEEAMSMHGHMLDFKKRGTFIRIGWRRALGRPAPDFGYLPEHIPFSRRIVEVVISGIFAFCGTSLARWGVEHLPLSVVGPLFDSLRKFWKGISKPTKRKGLLQMSFRATGGG